MMPFRPNSAPATDPSLPVSQGVVEHHVGNITQEITRTGTTAGGGSTKTTATSTFTTGRLTSRISVRSGLIYDADCENFWYDALGEETS